MTEKSKKAIDLIALFGVEGMVTPKTLINETLEDLRRKTPNDLSLDIQSILEELNVYVCSEDIDGVLQCIEACQLRVNEMHRVASEMKINIDRKKGK